MDADTWWADYRARLVECTRCAFDNRTRPHPGGPVLVGPRYGTGGRLTPPKLAILGQNPPSDPVRNQHGGWLLHYPHMPGGPHEELVRELVFDRLELDPMEVYVTQSFKCATANNQLTCKGAARACREEWLYPELERLAPQVLLIMGTEAGIAIADGDPRGFVLDEFPLIMLGKPGWADPRAVIRAGRRIHAPHPSVVGRFVERESWLKSISLAFTFATLEPALPLAFLRRDATCS